jgi:hypothetical protein
VDNLWIKPVKRPSRKKENYFSQELFFPKPSKKLIKLSKSEGSGLNIGFIRLER